LRGTLANIFIIPILPKITTIFSESIKSFTTNSTGVDVTFNSGKSPDSYDLLVAADGLGSHIRSTLLNAPARASMFDEGVHVAYFTVKKDLLNGEKVAKNITATGGRNIMIRPDPHPSGRSSALLMNMTDKSANTAAMKARLNEALKGGNEAYKALLQEQFSDIGWLGPEVLAAMHKSDDFYCSLVRLVVVS
jgi:2-polyprenyl-6-methoxyphenol hydroxylase-like FAD-dependent oxidoreductase